MTKPLTPEEKAKCTYTMVNRTRTSEHVGVHWCTKRKKWIAYGYIRSGGAYKKKCLYLGQYETEDEAAEARRACQENPPERVQVGKIDVNNMDTCTSFKRSDDDY
jgi:hypothetical protein